MSLYELFTLRELHLSPALLGIIIAAGGAFALVGAILAERIVKRLGYGRAAVGSAIYIGGRRTADPDGAWLGGRLHCLPAGGATGRPRLAGRQHHGGQSSPDRHPAHLLGRVNSAVYLLFRGLVPLGALAGGAAAGVIGVRSHHVHRRFRVPAFHAVYGLLAHPGAAGFDGRSRRKIGLKNLFSPAALSVILMHPPE